MGGIVSTVKDAFFGGAEKKAGEAEVEGQRAAARKLIQGGEDIQSLFQPQVESGQRSLELQSALTGVLGPEARSRAQQLDFQNFQESPAQKFFRERQERALLRNATAIGGIGGGNIRKALQEQAVGLASQQLSQQLELERQRLANLSGITDIGQRGLTQQAQGIQFGASGAAQGLIGEGEAKSSAITGQAAGIRTGVGQVATGLLG